MRETQSTSSTAEATADAFCPALSSALNHCVMAARPGRPRKVLNLRGYQTSNAGPFRRRLLDARRGEANSVVDFRTALDAAACALGARRATSNSKNSVRRQSSLLTFASSRFSDAAKTVSSRAMVSTSPPCVWKRQKRRRTLSKA